MLDCTPLAVSPKVGGMMSKSVLVTSFSNLSVLIVYSPLFAGTYSCRPTYSTSKTGFLPNAIRNSLAVLKVLNGGETASVTPYSGAKTETSIGKNFGLQDKKFVCHNAPC